MIAGIIFRLTSCVNGENFIVVLDGVVDFPAIILLVGDDAGDSLAFRMNGQLFRPHRVKALGAEFRRIMGLRSRMFSWSTRKESPFHAPFSSYSG